jgi:hypothetical protein
MEIHPPHQAIQSWREFLLHMTTIVLGILIAIGLEQAVGWVHHRQERSQLQKELREEAEKNQAIPRSTRRRSFRQSKGCNLFQS